MKTALKIILLSLLLVLSAGLAYATDFETASEAMGTLVYQDEAIEAYEIPFAMPEIAPPATSDPVITFMATPINHSTGKSDTQFKLGTTVDHYVLTAALESGAAKVMYMVMNMSTGAIIKKTATLSMTAGKVYEIKYSYKPDTMSYFYFEGDVLFPGVLKPTPFNSADVKYLIYSGVPDAPTDVSVAAGAAPGTALVRFTAPDADGGSAITGYTVTANPGGITATGMTSPITLTGLTPKTAYTYSVVAANSEGNSAPATTGLLNFYKVVETFHEPMTQPNNTIFTGKFTYDSTNKTVSNLKGSITESMTEAPMATVAVTNQLSSVSVAPGGVPGLLVTTFALNTINVFDGGGFAPGGMQYYGLSSGTPNNHNAYAMIFVNTTNPATALQQAQIDRLAYADCTAGGMMGPTCMTGTSKAGYGRTGTMGGYPVSQVITKQ